MKPNKILSWVPVATAVYELVDKIVRRVRARQARRRARK